MFRQLLPITALLTSTFLMLTAGGLAGILLPLRAGIEGWSPTTVGWLGTGYALAFTGGCIVVPRLVRRVGHVRVFAVLLTLLSMSMLMHGLIIDPWAWTLFRALAGFSLAGSYMVIESWLNERVTNATRGMVFSIYMIVSMIGLLVGQYILPFGNPATQALFMIGALIYAAALIPTGLSNAQSPRPLTQVSLDLPGLYRKSPAAMIGSLIAGIIAGAWNFLSAIYGREIGLSTFDIATMIASAMIGGAIFQYPIGRISDFVDRRYVMVVAGIIGVFLSVTMIIVQPVTPWVIYSLMFAFGTVLFPIYSLNVAHANDFAEPSEFVKVSSGLLIVYGIGSMIGPQIAGRLMDVSGPSGFFMTMAGCYAAYASYAFWRSLRRARQVPSERPDFVYHPHDRPQTPETLQLNPALGTAKED
ncbi:MULTISPECIES: MFS transporter [unclassified Phyllobacterium]|uniref:MFS transporter n=1 Tax=Phyllobacterium TaxID=28100 RepID=UPI000DD85BC1|nr:MULTISPECIES: MFS transporter [unclassified Phyllobacterium]MBA8901284.1 MFS family permease [Phyllobacterium sp. P30BS-XVII]UGX84703.1 MFS transporter [Phyllobacterium sp. T1293]